jgi:hypothetical protein
MNSGIQTHILRHTTSSSLRLLFLAASSPAGAVKAAHPVTVVGVSFTKLKDRHTTCNLGISATEFDANL